MFIDTHCHVVSEYYDDIDEVIKNAIDNGVLKIIINGYNMQSNREVLELVKKYDIVYPACGSSNSAVKLSVSELEKISNNIKWICVCKDNG